MLMKGAQCGTEMDLVAGARNSAELVVQAYSGKLCGLELQQYTMTVLCK